MSTLRASLIRLAATNPEVRPHVIPLLVKTAAEDNPDLIKMEKDCRAALKSVNKALAMLKKSPAAKSDEGTVVPSAVRDLTALAKALEKVVGKGSPFIWGLIDPDRV